ncbi:aminotransferase class V-fold PLP-dependent enzyme [Aliikangiella coralliicola]|uniref:cysteine desulfurase n=1 Tax=Aliikangiella coralliicola TaxID=2592383 RepID=A0A545UAB0_9GAMM|nr:aminotransferase class V-fold PLP-dependent enzyme [Aliikangiella coralliicola]TQV86379.1 aminotransferase class V-fold PLP-dependent enzyme [Aliikangiella coralliicola]
MHHDRLNEIYLDNNATTPVLEDAVKAAQDAMQTVYGNPSSTHVTGLRARYILDSTRDLAKEVVGAGRGNIIFLSGATEGIQTAIFSALIEIKRKISQQGNENYRYLLYGATEHKAVPNSLKHWNDILEIGAELVSIPVDNDGKLDYDFIEKHLSKTAMICTMAVNNETGVAQDLGALETLIRTHNASVPWMVDCVQALGKFELELAKTTIDYAPFSGHKIYAPKGIGMLYTREGAPLTPFIAGGGQESGLRSGTENLPGVAAFGAILKHINETECQLFKSHEVLAGFRNKIVETLKLAFPGIVFNMPFETSVPTTINFSVKDFPSKEILDLFDAAQIRVSSGSACSSGVTRSYVLDEMGLPAWQSESAIRMSFGPAVTEQEIDDACERILLASQALTQSCLMLNNLGVDIDSPRQEGLIQLKSGSACTWIYADSQSESMVVIDPVEELGERIEKFVHCQGYRVKAIVDTHSHADHESCRPMLQKLLQSQLSYDLKDYDELGWPMVSTQNVTLSDGQSVSAIQLSNNLVLAKLETPGHTSDSQSLLLGQSVDSQLKAEDVRFAFVGDTILIGGLGRTNFVSSSTSKMYDSLQTLCSVIGQSTLMCPSHDYNNEFATTVYAEEAGNALLHEVKSHLVEKSHFVKQKESLDKRLNDQVGHEILCGVVGKQCDSEGIHVMPEELQHFLKSHPQIRVLDVREAHEFHLFNDWDSLNLERAPENVPLSRLANFIGNNICSGDSEKQELLFVCRSGSRSAKVAETFRRLGFENARHISGGVALNCVACD